MRNNDNVNDNAYKILARYLLDHMMDFGCLHLKHLSLNGKWRLIWTESWQ